MITACQDQVIREEDKVRDLVLCLIEEIYDRKYIGPLEVKKKCNGYEIKIYWRSDTQPIVIAVDLEYGPKLKHFLYKELRDRRLHDSHHFAGWMALPFKKEHCHEKENR